MDPINILGIELEPTTIGLIIAVLIILFPQLKSLFQNFTGSSSSLPENSNAARVYYWEKLENISRDVPELHKQLENLRKDLIVTPQQPIQPENKK